MNAKTTTATTGLSGAALLLAACGTGGVTAASTATVPSTTTAPSTTTTTATAPPAATTAPATTPAPATGSTGAAPQAEPVSTESGGPGVCVTSDLEFSIEPSKGMGDVSSADVVITNVHANGPCGVFGYGGLGLMDAQGGALPTNLTRLEVPEQDLAPKQITLATGASALKHLEWTDTTATGGDVTGCVTSTDVVVTPPDDEPSAVFPFATTVCGGGTITGWPYVTR